MMRALLSGFTDELIKIGADPGAALLRKSIATPDDPTAKEIVQETTRPSPKNYMKTMALGALIAPLMALTSKRIGQVLHNRGVQKAMRGAKPMSVAAKRLRGELNTGPLFGPVGDYKPGKRPLMTPASIATDSMSGALTGSVIQAIKDAMTSDRR
jgi:hypothetical protein